MRLAALVFMLCSTTQAFAADPAKWFTCESSDDCILAKGPCGAATGVNRAYRGAFEKKAKLAPCRATVDFKEDRKGKGAACGLNGKCVTMVRKPE